MKAIKTIDTVKKVSVLYLLRFLRNVVLKLMPWCQVIGNKYIYIHISSRFIYSKICDGFSLHGPAKIIPARCLSPLVQLSGWLYSQLNQLTSSPDLISLHTPSTAVSCPPIHTWQVASKQCTVYNVQCTMYTVQCTMYNVKCTMYNYNNNTLVLQQLIGLDTLLCDIQAKTQYLYSKRQWYEQCGFAASEFLIVLKPFR